MVTRTALVCATLLLAAGLAAPHAEAEGVRRDARWIQQVLAAKRYYVGDIDGRWGPMMRSALRQFQMDHRREGLRPTGRADRATLDRLARP